jgi:hypothetical protein
MAVTIHTVPVASSEEGSRGGPVVIDLGRKSRKQIRRLRRGEGKLLNAITEVVDGLKTAGTISSSAQTVIVVVRERRPPATLWPFPLS